MIKPWIVGIALGIGMVCAPYGLVSAQQQTLDTVGTPPVTTLAEWRDKSVFSSGAREVVTVVTLPPGGGDGWRAYGTDVDAPAQTARAAAVSSSEPLRSIVVLQLDSPPPPPPAGVTGDGWLARQILNLARPVIANDEHFA